MIIKLTGDGDFTYVFEFNSFSDELSITNEYGGDVVFIPMDDICDVIKHLSECRNIYIERQVNGN